MFSISHMKNYQALLSVTSYAILHLALTSFEAISSPHSDAAMNQDGGNSRISKYNEKNIYIGPKSKTFSKKCSKLYDK